LVGALLLILESSAAGVFDLAVWVPHVGIGVVIYLALERDFAEAGLSTLLLAWVADLVGGAPPGIIGLSLTLVFFGVRLTTARFAYKRWLARVLLAVAAAFAQQTLVLAILLLVGNNVAILAPYALAALPSCLAAPIGMTLVWLPMSKLDGLFSRRSRRLLAS
jgi:cell shape-determining protein MreD